MQTVRVLFFLGFFSVLTGCALWPFGAGRPDLIEAEPQQVADCEQVGALSETLDADRIITSRARRQMMARLERRAQALGATHLVWVYRTHQTAAARVFRCDE